jgi:hypothetical protein
MDLTSDFEHLLLSHASTAPPHPPLSRKRHHPFALLGFDVHRNLRQVKVLLDKFSSSYVDFDHGMSNAERDTMESVVSEALGKVGRLYISTCICQ